jgi:molybdopterin/thiamine biosynthesis adenylyltransferase
MVAALSERQIDRYSRQIIMREIGGTGQSLLLRSRCLVAGSGPAFDVAAQYLAATGIGALDLLEGGIPDPASAPIGRSFARLESANPDVTIRVSRADAEASDGALGEAPFALADYDVLLEVVPPDAASDSSPIARRLPTGVPRAAWITLATQGRGDLVLVVVPREANACPACVQIMESENRTAPSRPAGDRQPSGLEPCVPTAIDLALAGTMAALAACRAIARISTDGALRVLRLDRDAPVWHEVAARCAPTCPRGCRK